MKNELVKVGNILADQEWYQHLIEDCKSIITERRFNASWELIQCKWEIGDRILKENDNFERAKIYGKKIATRVSQSLGCSKKEIERCIYFRQKYTDLNELPEGKAITWHKTVRLKFMGRRLCNTLQYLWGV